MKIISISGLDGSGKSTQINLLKEYLEAQGKKVFYFHAVAFSIANRKSANPNKPAKSVTQASWLKIQLRKLALLIDIVRFKQLVKKLANEGYNYILSDRYFYDNIINLAYLSNKNTPSKIEKYIPSADLAFYIKIQPEAIMTRDRVPDQGPEYLKAKKKLFDMYETLWDFQEIDGNKPKEEIFDDIRKKANLQ